MKRYKLFIEPLPLDQLNDYTAEKFNAAFEIGEILIYDTELECIEIPKQHQKFRNLGILFFIQGFELKCFKDLGIIQ